MKNTELNLLKKLESGWNDLSTDSLESFLTEDVIYKSQFVQTPLIGKSEVIEFLKEKFRTIRKNKKSKLINIYADIGYLPSFNMKPCIVLSQIISDKLNQVTVMIEIKRSLISKIDICIIPDFGEIIFLQTNQ